MRPGLFLHPLLPAPTGPILPAVPRPRNWWTLVSRPIAFLSRRWWRHKMTRRSLTPGLTWQCDGFILGAFDLRGSQRRQPATNCRHADGNLFSVPLKSRAHLSEAGLDLFNSFDSTGSISLYIDFDFVSHSPFLPAGFLRLQLPASAERSPVRPSSGMVSIHIAGINNQLVQPIPVPTVSGLFVHFGR